MIKRYLAIFLFVSTFAFAQGYVSEMDIGNVKLVLNTISTTNTNGDLTFDLNGTGSVIFNDLTATTVPYLDASKKLTSSAVTPTELAGLVGIGSTTVATQLSLKAPLASPTFTGSVNIGTTAGAIVSSAGGVLSSEAVLSPIRGGTGLDNSMAAGVLKFAIGTPSVSQVVNNDVSASAGIGVTKLEALTASRVAITDSSGFLTTEAALAIARGGTNNGSLAVTAGGVLYTDGSKFGNVGVGTTGQFLKSNAASAPSWVSVATKATGEVFMTASTTCPAGSEEADGTNALRSGGTECGGGDCATLFAEIGTTYGSADGTHFNFPDMRGVFARGAGTQTISAINYTGTQGTTQGDAFQAHQHGYLAYQVLGGGGFTQASASATNAVTYNTGSIVADGANGTPRTGSETRPANITLKYCIVY